MSCKKGFWFLVFACFFTNSFQVFTDWTSYKRHLKTVIIGMYTFSSGLIIFLNSFEVVFVSLFPLYSFTYSLSFCFNSPLRSNLEFGPRHPWIVNIPSHFWYEVQRLELAMFWAGGKDQTWWKGASRIFLWEQEQMTS